MLHHGFLQSHQTHAAVSSVHNQLQLTSTTTLTNTITTMMHHHNNLLLSVEKLAFFHLVKTRSSSPCSQQAATRPYPGQFNPVHIQFHFNTPCFLYSVPEYSSLIAEETYTRRDTSSHLPCSGKQRNSLQQGFSTHPGRCHIAVANEFCTTLPHICGYSVWNLLRVSLQTPRFLRCFLDFCKVGTPCSVVAPDLHLCSNHSPQPRMPHISHFIILRTYYWFMATTIRTR